MSTINPSAMQQLNYDKEKIVRSILSNGEIWFLSSDVCNLLEINQMPKVLASLDKGEIRTGVGIDQSGNPIKAKIISESGFYNLIFQSKNANSRKIKRWLTSEVLPQIRRTGNFCLDKTGQLNFVQRFWDNFDRVEPGYFSVIGELLWYIYAKIEKLGHVIPLTGINNKEIWPDISVGKLFSKWLIQKYPEQQHEYKTYSHQIRGRRTVEARQYPNRLLPYFREFLDNEWIAKNAARYFSDRDPKVLDYLPKLISKI